ncbi:acyl-CoA N-acyltransferase [Trichoderma evansii]
MECNNASTVSAMPTIRTHRPGDLGYIIHRHAEIYCNDYGWDGQFELLVAKVAADFLEHYDPSAERCWVAERDGKFLGSVMLVREKKAEHTAKLRLLLVEPAARGLGLGKQLVNQCIQFAKEVGYHRIVLWTQSILESARKLYRNAGFRLMEEEKHLSFGAELVGEHWELDLRG